MTENLLTAKPLQEFKPELEISLSGQKFIVEELGDAELLRPHLLRGSRGARYWMHRYLARPNQPSSERYYIVSIRGDGTPIRGKNGRRIEAFIFGDLISSVN